MPPLQFLCVVAWLLYPVCQVSSSQAHVRVLTNPDGTQYAAVGTNGDSHTRFDIVFVGDGFDDSPADQAAFDSAVEVAAAAIVRLPGNTPGKCGLNIWRVNVVSVQSGVDHPTLGVFRDTELDCRYGDTSQGEPERCIRSAAPARCFEAASYAPDGDAVFVLVNDAAPGGCSVDDLVFAPLDQGTADTVTHELGHQIAKLGDEYECYYCDGTDNDLAYTGSDPDLPNITSYNGLAALRWRDLVPPETPIPTSQNVPVGVVGLWEGGGYYATGLFRPAHDCHMRALDAPFCAVCGRSLAQVLAKRCSLVADAGSGQGSFVLDGPASLAWPGEHQFPVPVPTAESASSGTPSALVASLQYNLRGLPSDASVDVVDGMGNTVVSHIQQAADTTTIRFSVRRDRQYFVRLASQTPATTLQHAIVLDGELLTSVAEPTFAPARATSSPPK